MKSINNMGVCMINYRSVINYNQYAIKLNGDICRPRIVTCGMQCTFYYDYKEKNVMFKWILWDVENPTNEELESVKRHAKSLFEDEGCQKSMITDKEGQEWVLQKLYDAGWRYYAKNVGGTAFLTTKKPIMNQGILEITSGGTTRCINNISEIMLEIDKNSLVDIAEELGIVDWSKVPVDTPVLVRNCKESEWRKRYFAFYKAGKVHTWDSGATSWSKERIENTSWWNYVKLAEV